MNRGGRPIVAIDLETGGFVPGRHGILAIGCYWRETECHPAGPAKREHALRLLVERAPGMVVEGAAAEKNGWRSDEQWLALGAIPLRDALQLTETWLTNLAMELGADRLEPLGHNHAGVDRPFLDYWTREQGLEEDFAGVLSHAWHDSALAMRAAQVAGLVPSAGGVSMDAMLQHMGRRREVGRGGHVPGQVLHDAAEDAKACFDGYHWLTQLMRRGRA